MRSSGTPWAHLRPYPGKETVEVHDDRDIGTGELAGTPAGRTRPH